MTTTDYLPARDDQMLGPGRWARTYHVTGMLVGPAADWWVGIGRRPSDDLLSGGDAVAYPGDAYATAITTDELANTITVSSSAPLSLVAAGDRTWPGRWLLYHAATYRPIVGGAFTVDRAGTSTGATDVTELVVTTTSTTLTVLTAASVPQVLDTWLAAYAASSSTPADVVALTDSIGVLGSRVATPWGWRLAKALSAFDTRAESHGWTFAKATSGHVVLALDSCGGTESVAGVGGYSADLTAGQTAAHTCSCDGVSIVYTVQPGGGSIEVRDGGAGGTLVATIPTAGTSAPSTITEVDLTTYASRQVHLTITGGPVRLEGCYFHAGDRTSGTRVWTAGHSGYKTADFVANPLLAMNLVDGLDPALVVIATGYNDVSAAQYEADLRTLVPMVQAATSNDVAIMSPWGGVAGAQVGRDKAAAAARVATDLNLAYFPLYEMLGSVDNAIDPWDLSSDGAHPRRGASQMMADLVLAELAVDANLVALSTAERGPRELLGSIVDDEGTAGTANLGSVLGQPSVWVAGAGGASDTAYLAPAALGAFFGWNGVGLILGDLALYRTGAGQATLTGGLTAPSVKPSGLTGATAAVRFPGGTTGAAPTSGTFAVGDVVPGQDGRVWICTAAGTPGTWKLADSVPTFDMNVFSTQGSWLGPPLNGAVNAALVSSTATGRSFWVPVELVKGTYDRIGVYVFTVGTSTWRLGLDTCPMNTAKPTTLVLDAGTVNMAAGTGMQSATISLTIPVTGWYWARVNVQSYTSNPVIAKTTYGAGGAAPPFHGWPTNDFNATRSFVGFYAYNMGTGGLPAAPAFTGNPATGLAFQEEAPKVFFRRSS